MKKMIILFLLLVPFVLMTMEAVAQTADTLLCPECKQPNKQENSFCTSCGAKITDKTVAIQQGQSITYRAPARLLSVPTASVLPELALGLTLGNSFGQQEQQSFLRNVSLGIGNVAELELNTGGMVGNIVAGTSRMTTWALKVQVLSEHHTIPGIVLSLHSSNDWDNATFDSRTIEASNATAFREGLRWLDYDMRMTTASITAGGKILDRTSLYVTAGLSDIRFRNLGVQQVAVDFRYDPSVKRTSQWQAAAGVAIEINPRTRIIGEVQTIPSFNYNVTDGSLHLEHMYVGAAGIRFALSKAFSLDSGVRYQSNFVGLADTQVRVALNCILVIPI